MEGKQGGKGRAPGGGPGESSFLKHVCRQGVTPGYSVESLSGTRTWWTRNHNRQLAVVRASVPGLENNRNTCVEQRGQRFRGSRQGGNSYRPMDDPEKVESSIQSRTIRRDRGHVTDR